MIADLRTLPIVATVESIMTFLAVSTFNADGLRIYGDKMMSSFHRHWPSDVPLRVYSEGWTKSSDFLPAKVIDLETSSDWLAQFKYRHKHRGTADFRMDAVRFSHKIAALLHADATTSAHYLIWADGDIFTHSPITQDVLTTWVPGRQQWIAWLDRNRAYPECGFYIINRQHARHAEAIAALRAMYADDKLFLEKEWHDSYILQRVVDTLALPWKSLSGAMGRRTHHPFVNGPLGAYMDHMKGKRKQKGRSLRSDLHVIRNEEYWSGIKHPARHRGKRL